MSTQVDAVEIRELRPGETGLADEATQALRAACGDEGALVEPVDGVLRGNDGYVGRRGQVAPGEASRSGRFGLPNG